MPVAKPGVRVQIVSIEPIILLSVTRKIADVAEIEVFQPFYAPAWQAGHVSLVTNGTPASGRVKARLTHLPTKLHIVLRNIYLLCRLARGDGRYALARCSKRKIDVEVAVREHPHEDRRGRRHL